MLHDCYTGIPDKIYGQLVEKSNLLVESTGVLLQFVVIHQRALFEDFRVAKR